VTDCGEGEGEGRLKLKIKLLDAYGWLLYNSIVACMWMHVYGVIFALKQAGDRGNGGEKILIYIRTWGRRRHYNKNDSRA
jgi:hypothetical protein